MLKWIKPRQMFEFSPVNVIRISRRKIERSASIRGAI